MSSYENYPLPSQSWQVPKTFIPPTLACNTHFSFHSNVTCRNASMNHVGEFNASSFTPLYKCEVCWKTSKQIHTNPILQNWNNREWLQASSCKLYFFDLTLRAFQWHVPLARHLGDKDCASQCSMDTSGNSKAIAVFDRLEDAWTTACTLGCAFGIFLPARAAVYLQGQ